MKIIDFSKPATVIQYASNPDTEIHVVLQFFLHPHSVRRAELKLCMELLCKNPEITKIHLLNESIYSEEDIGVQSEKIVQTNLGKRLKFKDVFVYLRENQIKGYHVIINSDICFDETIANLRVTDIHKEKKMFAQLRFEYNPRDIQQSSIFGPRFDSQDTWIFHSNFAIPQKCEKMFNFQFGVPGCDNKLIYLMKVLGYEVINDPAFIKTYHIHGSRERNYSAKDRLLEPWGVVVPARVPLDQIMPSLGINLSEVAKLTKNFQEMKFEDNAILREYVADCLAKNKTFVVPRIAGKENNYAVFGRFIKESGGQVDANLMSYFQKTLYSMKNDAGIKITSVESILQYSNVYLNAFEKCELYSGWEPHGGVYRGIELSHQYIQNKYPEKRIFWAFALDIFHYIYSEPWTQSLRGKRILVISPFEDSIREKLPIREKLYDGVDLFPDCSFTFLKPPQTQGEEPSEEFAIEYAKFVTKIKEHRDDYDVALVSCGGYGNLVCSAIYENGKSAIYVGGVLQMYFGVLGARWLRERPDIVRMFLNEHWSRPKDAEKPKNFMNVEGSCYW